MSLPLTPVSNPTRSVVFPSSRLEADGSPLETQALRSELAALREAVAHQQHALAEAQCDIAATSEHFGEFYQSLPFGCVTLTPAGQIVAMNRLAETWLGLESGRARGESFCRFLGAFDAGRFCAHLDACCDAFPERVIETILRPARGGPRRVRLASRRIASGGSSPLVYTTLLEAPAVPVGCVEELRHDSAILADAVAHDLRAPSAIIQMYVRLLLTEHAATASDEAQRILQGLARASQRVHGAIERVMNYCAVSGGEIACERVETDELLRGILAAKRREMEGLDVALQRPIAPVRASARWLAEALGCVIATAAQRTTAASCRHLTISSVTDDSFVDLRISGAPFPSAAAGRELDALELHAAEPSQRLELAFVRRAIERMCGRIWLESRGEGGGCFHLVLPAA